MRKLILHMHASLDGYVATPDGSMRWIRLEEALFDDVGRLTATADTALYGRVTYDMMAAYWPNAGEKPNATRHEINHGRWANSVTKIVISTTLTESAWAGTQFLSENIPETIAQLKAQPGKNILMLGSPSTARAFMQWGLVDELQINVNPIVLGGGIPFFPTLSAPLDLELVDSKPYACGVVGLHYVKAG